MSIKDKVIIITGASSGLGATLAEKVAIEGAKVALVARSKEKLEKVKQNIESNGGVAVISICDIRELSQVQKTVKDIISRFGQIDILVNNAGIWTDDDLEKGNPARRKEAFEINALGNIQFTDEVLPYFMDKNSGYIFNVISTSGVADIPAGNNRDWQTYGATKWAMTGFTKTLRDKLQGTKIKVTGFFPGGFESNLYEKAGIQNPHNQPWMMKTEDVADVIVFALTRPSDVLMERIIVTKIVE
jgi:uncharacterized protein